MMIIHTLGTSNRDFEEFLRILKSFKVELVVDVRRFPTSRFEHFKKENLEENLKREGIGYVYLGDLLGDFREGGYDRYMESEDFRRGFNKLLELAEKRRIALICRERFPWKCHRWFISNKLMEKGYKVIHILDEKRTYPHKVLGNR